MWEIECKIDDFSHHTNFPSLFSKSRFTNVHICMALDADLNMTIETLHMWTVVPSWMRKIDNLSPGHNEKAI